MTDNKVDTETPLIKSLLDCLSMYMGGYKSSGILSPLTSFKLEISGPVGREEFDFLIQRLKLERNTLGDSKVRFCDAYVEAQEYLKEIKEHAAIAKATA